MKNNEKKQNPSPIRRAVQRRDRREEASTAAGYYDFSPEYPGAQQDSGVVYRKEGRRTTSLRTKLLIALAAALVFCTAFTVCRVMFRISEKEPGSVGNEFDYNDETAPPEYTTVPVAVG